MERSYWTIFEAFAAGMGVNLHYLAFKKWEETLGQVLYSMSASDRCAFRIRIQDVGITYCCSRNSAVERNQGSPNIPTA